MLEEVGKSIRDHDLKTLEERAADVWFLFVVLWIEDRNSTLDSLDICWERPRHLLSESHFCCASHFSP